MALLMSSFLTSCSIQALAYIFPEQEFCSLPLLVETWSLDDISLCLQIHLRLGLSGGESQGKGPGGLSYPVSSNCCSQNLQGSWMHRRGFKVVWKEILTVLLAHLSSVFKHILTCFYCLSFTMDMSNSCFTCLFS